MFRPKQQDEKKKPKRKGLQKVFFIPLWPMCIRRLLRRPLVLALITQVSGDQWSAGRGEVEQFFGPPLQREDDAGRH